MLRRPDADRAERQLVRRLLRELDEFLHRPHRQGRRHHHDERHIRDQIDRRKFGDRIIDWIAREMRSHGERSRGDQHDVPVRRRFRHVGIGDSPSPAGLVLDDGGLVEARLQPARDFPRHDVVGTARRERHDDPDQLVGKGLRIGGRDEAHNGDHAGGKQFGHTSSQLPRGGRSPLRGPIVLSINLPQSPAGCQCGKPTASRGEIPQWPNGK